MERLLKQNSRLDQYEIIRKLGSGQYGEVFQVRHRETGQFFALKKVQVGSYQRKEKLRAFQEVKALRLIHHPSIVQYHDSFLSMEHLYIVMEYAGAGDFGQIIRARRTKEKPFTEDQLWTIFEAVAVGVKYLHENNMIHRDLKLDNLFLTKDKKVKIGDLGMVRFVHSGNEEVSNRVGTPIYFAPELIRHELYSYPIDVWALGCIFYSLATLGHPFEQASLETLPYYIIQRDLKPIKAPYSQRLIQFIYTLLHKDPAERVSIYEVVLAIRNRRDIKIEDKMVIHSMKHLLDLKEQELKDLARQNQKRPALTSRRIRRLERPLANPEQAGAKSPVKTHESRIRTHESKIRMKRTESTCQNWCSTNRMRKGESELLSMRGTFGIKSNGFQLDATPARQVHRYWPDR